MINLRDQQYASLYSKTKSYKNKSIKIFGYNCSNYSAGS